MLICGMRKEGLVVDDSHSPTTRRGKKTEEKEELEEEEKKVGCEWNRRMVYRRNSCC